MKLKCIDTITGRLECHHRKLDGDQWNFQSIWRSFPYLPSPIGKLGTTLKYLPRFHRPSCRFRHAVSCFVRTEVINSPRRVFFSLQLNGRFAELTSMQMHYIVIRDITWHFTASSRSKPYSFPFNALKIGQDTNMSTFGVYVT